MASPTTTDRQRQIRALFDEYIEMYAARDERLTTRFSDNFSGYAGSGEALVTDKDEWIRITRQDFAQVPGRIRIEMLDLSLQDLSDDVVVTTAFFHIHLPIDNPILAREVARLVLIFRREHGDWKIAHSGISIPYQHAHDGEVYPIRSLQARNSELEALVEQRTQALHDSEALYRLLTEDAVDVIWQADGDLRITYISPADERLRGFQAHEVIRHHVFEMFTDEGVSTVGALLQGLQTAEPPGASNGFLTFEAQHRCKDGRLLWGEVRAKPDRNAQGDIVGYHGITRDITERRGLEDQIRQLAFHDQLTRLANRRLLEDHLGQGMASSKRRRRHGSLLFLDLDNFKSLNDAHGHGAGDLLLVEVAHRLRDSVREVDTVARFGGDEFVVLLSDLSVDRAAALSEAGIVAEKIRARLSQPYVLNVKQADQTQAAIEHHCTASIGVVVFDGREGSLNDVIDWADSAMYQAKEDGRNLIRFHEQPLPAP
jgi:diguanylate cyclase (GGDEF)-like protein/PAS domain S-box-containing protein